ncbi:hypothetical protein ACFC1B_30640, partial [Streptomyces xiamenensis]|uniref:hypothetical protein n=1 Tax=Streptomyces xiamenensis TaxID=408015 RepID=UPI0035D769AB
PHRVTACSTQSDNRHRCGMHSYQLQLLTEITPQRDEKLVKGSFSSASHPFTYPHDKLDVLRRAQQNDICRRLLESRPTLISPRLTLGAIGKDTVGTKKILKLVITTGL